MRMDKDKDALDILLEEVTGEDGQPQIYFKFEGQVTREDLLEVYLTIGTVIDAVYAGELLGEEDEEYIDDEYYEEDLWEEYVDDDFYDDFDEYEEYYEDEEYEDTKASKDGKCVFDAKRCMTCIGYEMCVHYILENGGR